MDIKYFRVPQQYNFKLVVGVSSESEIGMWLKSIFGIAFLGPEAVEGAYIFWFKSIILVKIVLSFYK
jgi:hypothetical protein